MKRLLIIIYLLVFSSLAVGWIATDLLETRTGAAETESRSATVLRAFKKIHPCPSTNSTDVYAACPGWEIDHPIPRDCGGRDIVSNLQWMPVELKRCAGDCCKDRWEREVYCYPRKGPVIACKKTKVLPIP